MASTIVAKKLSSNMNMCEGPLLKKIIVFTIPIILTNLLQLMFNAADLMVVGQFCGSNSVAAVGATTSLVHLIINLFMGLSSGVGVAVATGIGAGSTESIRKTVHTAIPLSLICGALLTVLGLVFAGPLLRIMDTPKDVVDLSILYVKVYFCGMIPSMLYNFGAAVLRADGDTKKPLIFLTFSGIVNIFLNIIFVTLIDMDVAGVALATAISQAISAALVLFELFHKNDACRLDIKHLRIYPLQLKRILSIGLPAGLQSTTFSLSNVIIQSAINSFDAIAVAGSAAAGSIEGFVFTGVDAFQQTSLNFVGQNYGAGKIDRVKKILLLCISGVIITELVMGIAVNVFSRPLLSLYVPDSAVSISYGARRMMLISLFYFLAGIMNVFSGTIRALGHSVIPMIISILSNCVFRLFWVFAVFGNFKDWKYSWELLFSSYPISWTFAIVIEVIMYIIIIKKYKGVKALN